MSKRSKCGSRGALSFESTLEPHAELDEDMEIPSLVCGEPSHGYACGEEGVMGVSVRIEQTVSVERAKMRLREDYRTPRTMTSSSGSVSRDL